MATQYSQEQSFLPFSPTTTATTTINHPLTLFRIDINKRVPFIPLLSFPTAHGRRLRTTTTTVADYSPILPDCPSGYTTTNAGWVPAIINQMEIWQLQNSLPINSPAHAASGWSPFCGTCWMVAQLLFSPARPPPSSTLLVRVVCNQRTYPPKTTQPPTHTICHPL